MSNQRKKIEKRTIEELQYEKVADEIINGEIRKGLWAKAIADSNGDKSHIEAKYIKYRIQSMNDESDSLKIDIEGEDESIISEIKNNFPMHFPFLVVIILFVIWQLYSYFA